MVRSRSIARLIFAAALLALGLPFATRVPASAAVQQQPVAPSSRAVAAGPVLAVPRALLRSAAVPVIVEMNALASSTLLGRSAALQNLLAGVQGHMIAALHADHAHGVYTFHTIPAMAATVAGADLPSLLAQPGVRAIVLDGQHSLLPIPDAENVQTHALLTGLAMGRSRPRIDDVATTAEPESYSLTGASVAQAHGYTGAGVRVAIIDSGLDITQPDLAGTVARDVQGVPLRVDFTGTDLQDTVGHGTACASMIAAQGRMIYSGNTKNELQIYPVPSPNTPIYRSHFRVYGMAPGVRLMSAKIFDTRVPNGSGGYDSWIVRAIEWAVDHHADVISESFGGRAMPSDGTDPVALADEAAIRAGVTVVAANGNEGPGQTTVSTPANAPGVIAVGASTAYRHFGQIGFLAPFGRTTTDNIASFTSRGPTSDGRPRPDLVAPGAYSWALFPVKKSEENTSPPYDVGTFGGTSQATPVTAGAAALVISAYRQAHNGLSPSPAMVRSILMSSAHDLGYPAFDQGAGRLDAWKAVQTAVHSGPSFLLRPNALAISGPVYGPYRRTFALTNSGTTVQRYTFDAVVSHLAGITDWRGIINGTALDAFHFTVKPGLERVVGTVYWNSADRFQVEGSSKAVAMRVALYDPLGRFVNYWYGVGTGYAAAEVAHPMPGVWSLVVSENGRKDNEGVRRYTREPFQAHLYSYVSVPYGTLSPAAVTLAPGHAAQITLRGRTPLNAGMEVVTVHVHGDHTAALPVALTSYITLHGATAVFKGSFTGPSNDYFSLTNENKVYSLNIPKGTRSINVFVSWPDPGYGVWLMLIDPGGETVDNQFNGITNGNFNGPFDLSLRNLEAIWTNPAPGRWQIVVMDAVFSGQQRAEAFKGVVTLDDTPVTPLAVTRTVLPGASFTISLHVRNDNGPNVAEGYIGYATTDQYSYVPLGNVNGPFGNSSNVIGSDVYTYTTGFVPPGTRLVVSSVAVVHPSVTADLAMVDAGGSQHEGQSATATIGSHTYQATVAAVSGRELPIGPWFGEVTLRRPYNSRIVGSVVGTSYAYALTPLSWITFDHGLLQNGHVTGGQPLILLPGQRDALHASVTVPLNTPPGIYHAHLFVYTFFVDKAADIPLTIVVQAHTGTEPAAAAPQGS